MPGFPWQALLKAEGVADQRDFLVRELDAVQALGRVFLSVPLESWQSYLRYHYLAKRADVLPRAFDDEAFEFYERTIDGQAQQQERWKRAVTAIDRDLGEAVGELYVRRFFPPSSKTMMLELVENMRPTYAQRLAQLPWMSAATKRLALEKLAAFRAKIGYPDRSRDYTALNIVARDALGNAMRSAVFDWERQVKRLGTPTDRNEWRAPPQTVNAFYNAAFNDVIFPAAILQPPFFDPNADAAVNYGGTGAGIGHEMGHAFDDQGAKSDARGVLHTCWLPADAAAFEGLGSRLVAQYDRYTVLPGLNINGRLTLDENIGDLGGLSVAMTLIAVHCTVSRRRLPRQGHSLKVDSRVICGLGMNIRGGTRPRLSCGRSSLYSCNQVSVISRTCSTVSNT